MQLFANLLRSVGTATALSAHYYYTGRDHTGRTCQSHCLPPPHTAYATSMTATSLSLDRALELTRTGDIWLFRGHSVADRAIRITTNSPVNHVGMSVVLDDLPALIWHAELGRSLPDMWSGVERRGVQLHNLRDAVLVWAHRYGQQAWLRQLNRPATREMEDSLLRTIARLDGTPFPSTAALAGRWLRGRVCLPRRRVAVHELESAYCAEIVATTYQSMGLLSQHRSPNWYDPGSFWSGDGLRLSDGYELGGEIAVQTPAGTQS